MPQPPPHPPPPSLFSKLLSFCLRLLFVSLTEKKPPVRQQPSSDFWNPPTTRSSPESNYATLLVNLTHPIRTTQLALAHFLSRPSSPPSSSSPPKSIIHISSIAGQITPLVAPLYVASKHGLSGFMRSLAPLERRLGIRVAGVAPGIVRTSMFNNQPEKMRLVAQDGRDSWVSREEVAEAMVKLAEGGEVEVIKKEEKRMVTVEGGLILEIQKGRVRVVEQYVEFHIYCPPNLRFLRQRKMNSPNIMCFVWRRFMDEGPSGEGTTLSGLGAEYEEIFKRLEGRMWGMNEEAGR